MLKDIGLIKKPTRWASFSDIHIMMSFITERLFKYLYSNINIAHIYIILYINDGGDTNIYIYIGIILCFYIPLLMFLQAYEGLRVGCAYFQESDPWT